jgi:hypothetical protein
LFEGEENMKEIFRSSSVAGARKTDIQGSKGGLSLG